MVLQVAKVELLLELVRENYELCLNFERRCLLFQRRDFARGFRFAFFVCVWFLNTPRSAQYWST